MNYINPFSDYGKIVQNERFVGRQREITTIQNRLLGSNYGNLAIMGLPRIGKSSLAHNAIFKLKDDLLKDRTLVFWINTGSITNSKFFFLKLALDAYNLIQEIFEEADMISIEKSYKKLNLPDLNEIEFSSYLQNFFRKVKSTNHKLIFVLDEFDNSERIFRVEDFQLLRELSNDPSTQVALLTISRRTLQELEPENGALSNFYQIFSDLHLGFYNETDLLLYWNFVKGHNVVVGNDTIKSIEYYVSSHPFLLDLINYDIFNNIKGHSINFEEVFSSIINNLRLKILNEYGTILKLMREENIASKAIQIIVGPVYDIRQIDVEKLQKYQLIIKSGDDFVGFCPYFTNFLKLSQNEIEVWPLFSEFEIEMRSIIKQFLTENYGELWEDKFPKQDIVAELKINREVNKRAFGEKAPDDLINYTYPKHFFDGFITTNWNWFKPIFKKDKSDWKPKFSDLVKVRNPLAHNNFNFLTESDKNKTTGYCQEILELIQKWKKSF
jgi:AAA+ ATPase superfamily predicted ATPase